jgi:prevent-host-death family protein
MDVLTGIEPISTLKTRTAELLRRTRDTGQPIVITQNGKAAAVLQDVESYQRQRDMLQMLRILVQGDQDFREGRVRSNQDARKHFDRKIDELKHRAQEV